MQLCMLGPLEIRSDSGEVFVPGGGRQRLLLAALLLHRPRIVSADRLVDIVWGDALPADPGAALRTQVSRLRALLAGAGAADRLRRGEASGYGLLLEPGELDADVFEERLRQARGTASPADGLVLVEQALGVWRDEPFGDLGDLLYFAGERARLLEMRAGARERRVECQLALGRTQEAVAAAEALILEDPLRERSRALAMQALYQAGRQHDALQNFQEYRRLLSREHGLAPSPAIRALETAIVQHTHPAPVPAVVVTPVAGSAAATAPPAAFGPPAAPGPPAAFGAATGSEDGAGLRQQIRFATGRDGVRLAYATVGCGPPLVKAANWLNHLEFDWESPVWRRLFRELAARHTFIRYDERACGLSDLNPAEMSLEAWVLDLENVVDACGLERFPLLGISQGCAVSIEYAARHPERVSGLILHGGYAAGWRADPSYGTAERARRDASIEIVRHGWGEDTPAYRQMFTQTFIPGGTADEIAWFNELQRRTVTPENAARFMEAFAQIDVRHRLASVRAPTLVLHSRGDQRIHFDRGRELAMGIPGARFVPLESDNHLILEHEPAFELWMSESLHFLAEELAMVPPV